MELKTDVEKKAKIQKVIIKCKKSTAIMRNISIILLMVGIIVGGILLLIKLSSSTICMQNVNGVMKKDVGWAIISSSFLIVPCLILSICFKKLVDNLGGKDCSSRIEESLIIKSDSLFYSFRMKHQTFPNERFAITIPFDRVDAVKYDRKTKQLLFSGKIQSDYYDDYKNASPKASDIIEGFIIYDYFKPSLYDKLSGIVKIVEE